MNFCTNSLLLFPILVNPLIYISTAINPSVMTTQSCPAHHLTTPEKNVIDLGGYKDGVTSNPHNLILSKSALTEPESFQLHLDSQITTGSGWMCIDVYKKSAYPVKNGDYHDALKNLLTREYKESRSEKGCDNHHISVGKFQILKGSVGSNTLLSGAPERSVATLIVDTNVAIGSYVVLLGYGSTFRTTSFPSFKEIHIDVVN